MNDGKGNVGMEHPVARFKELFCRLNAENTELGLLQVVYSPTVIFEDIFHRVEGWMLCMPILRTYTANALL